MGNILINNNKNGHPETTGRVEINGHKSKIGCRKILHLTILFNMRLFRCLAGGKWFLHEFTKDAEQLTFTKGKTFWSKYPEINRYSKVIKVENYEHR